MDATSARVRAIGEPALLAGYALCGVDVLPARNDEEARGAWAALPPGTAVVLLTADAGRALEPFMVDQDAPMTVVLP